MTVKQPRAWFNFKNSADGTVAEIYVVDYIGSWDDEFWRQFGYDMGVTAKSFIEQLAALDASVATIKVHINSPGGDVFAALNIANALRDQQTSKGRTVETICDGLAASAASIVLMAGSRVRMADNALVMIHNPWTIAMGEAKDMRQVADELDKVRATIVATYQWHTELEDAELAALMDATTWLDAAEALEKGFVTDVDKGLAAAASLRPEALASLTVPEKYKNRVQAFLQIPEAAGQTEPKAETPPATVTAMDAVAVLDACTTAGVPDLARELIAAQLPAAEVQTRIAEAQATAAAAAARATEIRAVCQTAHLTELADGYIAGAMPVDVVRQQLTTITAKLDKVEIDANLTPESGRTAKAKASLNPASIYAERNAVTKS